MFSIARTLFNTSKKLCPSYTNVVSNFHGLVSDTLRNTPKIALLAVETPSLIPNCGFKVMGKVRRRCKDCFFVCREERMYVLCKTHRRHKQMSMVKRPRNTWILSHATQSKIRPW